MAGMVMFTKVRDRIGRHGWAWHRGNLETRGEAGEAWTGGPWTGKHGIGKNADVKINP